MSSYTNKLYMKPMAGLTRPLPRVRVAVGRKPMKLYSAHQPPPAARLEILRQLVTRLFREQRIELPAHRAFECRSYAERLLLMAIEYGDENKEAMELYDWWLTEKELVPIMFHVYVPRYRNMHTAFTNIYRLPAARYLSEMEPDADDQQAYAERKRAWAYVEMAVLELKGHPYPAVVPQPEMSQNSLLNVLLRTAKMHAERFSAREVVSSGFSSAGSDSESEREPLVSIEQRSSVDS